VKNLKVFAENIKWELVYDPIEEKGALRTQNKEHLLNLADAMADKLLQKEQQGISEPSDAAID
jgi:hypothetical protein